MSLTPRQAYEMVRAAQSGMTDVEVAEHACALAAALASGDNAAAAMAENFAKVCEGNAELVRLVRALSASLRQVQNLRTTGQKSASRSMLDEVAGQLHAFVLDFDPPAPFDRAVVKRTEEVWTDVYSPKGSAE